MVRALASALCVLLSTSAHAQQLLHVARVRPAPLVTSRAPIAT
jgi:hypothetical protein